MSTTDFYLQGGYATSNPGWHQEDSPWKASQIAAMIRRHQLRPAGICEVGCGAGAILGHLDKMLPETSEFVGFEPSPQAFLMAQQNATARISFFNRSAPTDGSCFDLVLVIDVLEHIEDCFSFLRSIRGAGRQFILHIPLDLSVLSVFREWPLLKRRQGVGHIHYFTKGTALALLEDCGFEVQDHQYTTIWRDTEHSLRQTLLRRLPHRLLGSLGKLDVAARVLGEYSLLVLAQPRNATAT